MPVIVVPLYSMVPLRMTGGSRPMIDLHRLVFPMPLRPSRATSFPSGTSSVTPLSTSESP